jgi:hypothetical protein
MKESPPLLDLLQEIAITNPLQIPSIFEVFWHHMLRPFTMPPLSPLQQVVYRKVFMDKMGVLIKLGYVAPIFESVKNKKEIDDFLKLHFVKMVFLYHFSLIIADFGYG